MKRKKYWYTAFFMAIMIIVTTIIQVDAKENVVKKCRQKGNVKTCRYYIPNSDVGQKVITVFRSNGTKKTRTIEKRAPFLNTRIVYQYNRQGKLNTNKYGPTKRTTKKYTLNENYSKLLLLQTEVATYNGKAQIKKIITKYPNRKAFKETTFKYHKNTNKKMKTVKSYDLFLYRKVIYKYNKIGQLKSNKNGNATRTFFTYSWDSVSKKAVLDSHIIDKYTSTGKLKNIKKQIRIE